MRNQRLEWLNRLVENRKLLLIEQATETPSTPFACLKACVCFEQMVVSNLNFEALWIGMTIQFNFIYLAIGVPILDWFEEHTNIGTRWLSNERSSDWWIQSKTVGTLRKQSTHPKWTMLFLFGASRWTKQAPNQWHRVQNRVVEWNGLDWSSHYIKVTQPVASRMVTGMKTDWSKVNMKQSYTYATGVRQACKQKVKLIRTLHWHEHTGSERDRFISTEESNSATTRWTTTTTMAAVAKGQWSWCAQIVYIHPLDVFWPAWLEENKFESCRSVQCTKKGEVRNCCTCNNCSIPRRMIFESFETVGGGSVSMVQDDMNSCTH